MHLKRTLLLILSMVCNCSDGVGQEVDTLPALKGDRAPSNLTEMWSGFDPQREPLEVEILKAWDEDDVRLRVVRFRIGVFKGQKAKLAAVYGFPKAAGSKGDKIPGLVQIHGGGQYADYQACVANAKRGYATVSLAWAGRISAPGYRVSPAEVQLFWDGKRDSPHYKVTTDWGALDGYHAPGRNPGNSFPSAKPAKWTLDRVESPRNSGWFLCALAARRAITFLERQPEVDSDRIGIYGHSMGGKLTVLAAVDSRVKAAAPSCGGISDRDNKSPLFCATLGDDISLRQVSCPIIFLSPANDFHGRIGDLPAAVAEIASEQWRVTCSPHHNHQDTPAYEVATLLWMDQHLKNAFSFPQTPETTLNLQTDDGVPLFSVQPDASQPILSVDVFYTQQGIAHEAPHHREETMHRFWHHASATQKNGRWATKLPIYDTGKPLWVYANVKYSLDKPVSGAGYYYRSFTTNSFNLSSLLTTVKAEKLRAANVRPTLSGSNLIEDFGESWEKEWFTYRPAEWARTTNKLHAPPWQAPLDARLAIEVQAAEPNKLVVLIDNHAAEVQLRGGEAWQQVVLKPHDFLNVTGEARTHWNGIRQLKLSPVEHLRPKRGAANKSRKVGATWQGTAPRFRNLRWQPSHGFLDFPRGTLQKKDYAWTTNHMHVGVRWQPCIGRPQANACDAAWPVLAGDRSHVQFWANWVPMEPTPAHTDYQNHPTPSLQAIETAVDFCNSRGRKGKFVFFPCSAWATESGKAVGFEPLHPLFEADVKRIARHFQERYRISSCNRIREHFTALLYASDAKSEFSATVTIPTKIMSGRHDNRGVSHRDVRGEGFANGDTYFALITKEIRPEEGSDVEPVY